MKLLIRIQSRVTLDEKTGCHNWIGAKTPRGYGKIGVGKKVFYTHRLIYELFRGPLGLNHVDHLCRNPSCCNIDHLDSVTSAENTRRGIGPTAKNAAKTHCPNGHEFSQSNTYILIDRGSPRRKCKICKDAKLTKGEVSRLGGLARAKSLSKERRAEISRMASSNRCEGGKLIEVTK